MSSVGAKDFCLHQNLQTGSGPHPAFEGYRSSFPGVKQPERDADHLPLSTADFKSEWSYTSAPPVCLNGTDRKTLPLRYVLRHLLLLFGLGWRLQCYFLSRSLLYVYAVVWSLTMVITFHGCCTRKRTALESDCRLTWNGKQQTKVERQ
jgi:hypothetical protein